MANNTITVSIAWWLAPYIQLLCLVCDITGKDINMDKLDRVIGRAIKVK